MYVAMHIVCDHSHCHVMCNVHVRSDETVSRLALSIADSAGRYVLTYGESGPVLQESGPDGRAFKL